MYACMHVCMHVWMYACMHVWYCKHTHAHTHTHTHTHLYTHSPRLALTYLCMFVSWYGFLYKQVNNKRIHRYTNASQIAFNSNKHLNTRTHNNPHSDTHTHPEPVSIHTYAQTHLQVGCSALARLASSSHWWWSGASAYTLWGWSGDPISFDAPLWFIWAPVYTHFWTLVPCEKGHSWPKTN